MSFLTPDARGGDIGYVEDFALAKDRAAALKQLIPGTEDYYYYHCLHYLNTGQFDKVERLDRAVVRTARPDRPTHRDPDPPCPAHLREEPREDTRLPRGHLGLHFDHQKETARRRRNLPICSRPVAHLAARPSSDSHWIAGATSTTSRTWPSTGWPPRTSTGSVAATSCSGSSGPTSPTCRSSSSMTDLAHTLAHSAASSSTSS